MVFLLNDSEVAPTNFVITACTELVVVTFNVPQILRAPSTTTFVPAENDGSLTKTHHPIT